MPFAQGSRTQLAYIVESTFGTTPATPAMIALPFNTHSLSLTKESIESGEIRADRNRPSFRHGNKQVAGSIETEFKATDYDDLLESAFFGQITSNVLKNGVTQQSLSIEDGSLDIAQYRVYTGCVVNSLSMSIQPNAIVTANFDIVGKSSPAISGTPLDASITAPSGNDPMDSFSGTLNEGGSPIATVTGLDFQIDNGLGPTFVVGSDVSQQMEYGRCTVSGTITCYYENATLLNKFINETESSLEIALSDGTNVYTFDFPRIKYSGADAPVANEQSRIITMPFVALYNAADTATVILTKSTV